MLINSVLTAKNLPQTIADLRKCAKRKGMSLERSGKQLTLVTYA